MAFADLRTDYAGRGAPLFRLALKTGVLTVLTLGFYRFWMKTRMRRYYWSAIRPGGVPMEYTAQATEKLLGFLIAVVILAFYIGVVNLILMFFSFSLFAGNAPAYAVSVVGLVPIFFFAQYRARRYILARTRWRGIRFGLEPGVKGYVWRAMLHWAITILTLGILWPRMTFALEKYRTDRTWYGDAKFAQGGRWQDLMGAMKHVYLGAAIMGGGTLALSLSLSPIWSLAIVMGGVWTGLGLSYWRAESFKRLTEWKTLGDVGFRCHPRGGTVVGIYILGSLAISGLLIALVFGLMMILGIAVSMIDPGVLERGFSNLDNLASVPGWIITLLGVVAYFSVFLFWGVLKEVFIKLPLVRHFAETTEILNPGALAQVRQRPRDEFAEAEGFADALPLGGGF
ncbi:DUF898 family protein [Maritimibacter fusiformis]|uniref:DUF898 domain-containing protein n=1 Tax=Maritimibacter fusiformis TaxID=2603819 RepID=A0A5D0RHD3_9RHOB|nr:DUF898 family protein [Maritimibacter fusiformis]TYB80078.1 DUF898 domain-containing protein [Maritimibacter fusiformis]